MGLIEKKGASPSYGWKDPLGGRLRLCAGPVTGGPRNTAAGAEQLPRLPRARKLAVPSGDATPYAAFSAGGPGPSRRGFPSAPPSLLNVL